MYTASFRPLGIAQKDLNNERLQVEIKNWILKKGCGLKQSVLSAYVGGCAHSCPLSRLPRAARQKFGVSDCICHKTGANSLPTQLGRPYAANPLEVNWLLFRSQFVISSSSAVRHGRNYTVSR